MRLSGILIMFYILISVAIGMALIGFSLQIIKLDEVIFYLHNFYYDLSSRIVAGASGLCVVLLGLLFAQTISARREREKTIAFDNSTGQVTITLFAVEDLIRRIGQELPEVKELRPDVIATKKRGLQVRIRLVLKTETNIPEFTSHLQDLVRAKIQETLGIEEQIVVSVHIAKIVTNREKIRPKKTEAQSPRIEEQIHAPYQHM